MPGYIAYIRDTHPHPPGAQTSPYFRPKWSNSMSYFRPKRLKNHTLWRRTYLYSLCKGVPPPRTQMHFLLSRDTLVENYLIEGITWEIFFRKFSLFGASCRISKDLVSAFWKETSSKYEVSVASTDLMKEIDILLTMTLLLTFIIDTLPFSAG